MHIRLTHSGLYVHVHRVFEAKGRRDKGARIKLSDVRSLYPKQGITDAVIDYYVRYIKLILSVVRSLWPDQVA